MLHCAENRWTEFLRTTGPSFFFKGDMQLTAQPVDKIQNDVRFRLDHTFHHELPGIIPDRNQNASLCTSMPIYLVPVIKGCSFLEGLSQAPKPYSIRGALLYCAA
jgi:hypothetical protein